MFGKKKKQMTQADTEEYMKIKQKHMVDLVKSTFDSAGWEYTFKPDQKVIVSGFMGDDLPIHLAIAVREMSLHFLCNLDFVAEPEKFKEVCWALNDINRTLSFGAFYLNPDGGQISFEYGLIFLQTDYTEEMLAAQIKMIVDTVDKHDGDLQKIAKKAPSADTNNPMFG